MKSLKLYLGILIVSILTTLQFSCEDNESGVDLIGLESRFITEISQNKVTFTNVSNQATSYLWDFGDGSAESTAVNPVHTYDNLGTYTVTLTAKDASGNSVVFSDDITILTLPFNGGLVVNGDFETGSASPWIQGVNDNAPAPITTVGDNTYYSINITTPTPGSPFNINVSQKLEIISGSTYTLTFDAWSNVNRSIIAGIGLSSGSFANNSQPINITTTQTTYQMQFTANGFGAPDARVLFDLADEAGMVNIDNVSLFIN